MPLSIREVEYFKQIRGNYDPKLSKKNPSDLMQHLLHEIEDGTFMDDVMEYCMTVLASVTLRSLRINDVESQCALLDYNVCGAIKRVLDEMGATNLVVARKGCEAVRNLAWGSTDFCDVIIDANLSESLVRMCEVKSCPACMHFLPKYQILYFPSNLFDVTSPTF